MLALSLARKQTFFVKIQKSKHEGFYIYKKLFVHFELTSGKTFLAIRHFLQIHYLGNTYYLSNVFVRSSVIINIGVEI